VLLTKYHWGDQRKDEMYWACRTHGGEEKSAQDFDEKRLRKATA